MPRKKNEDLTELQKAGAETARKKHAKRTPKVAPKKTTHVLLLVDKSGSMDSVRQAAYDGINEQLLALKAKGSDGGETFVTFIQFADTAQYVFVKRNSNDLEPICAAEYRPMGSTALRDSLWTGINLISEGVEVTADTAFLVVVISDGEENASKLITRENLSERIKQLEATEKWTFTYMLANVDIHKFQSELGAKMGNVSMFMASPAGTAQAFNNASLSTSGYLNSRSRGVTAMADFYTPTVTKDDDTTGTK
jgi:Mg-chelatase subunit ChlD